MAVTSNPATGLELITPSDTTDLAAKRFRSLWVGGAGNIAVIAQNDSTAVTISGVAAGTLLPIAVKKVMSTNTTATLIVGLK